MSAWSGSVCLALGLSLAGCASESYAPLDPGQVSVAARGAAAARDLSVGPVIYPLAVGNRWHASRVFLFYGGEERPDTFLTSEDRVIIGTEVWDGHTYFVEARTATQTHRPGEVFRSWTRLRQDRAGMYSLYICSCEPPRVESRPPTSVPLAATVEADGALAHLHSRLERMRDAVSGASLGGPPGGATQDELLQLRYPLHVGQSWARSTLTWTVEGIERLDTPAGKFPAYRIRISTPDDGPNDFNLVWIGRAGRLAHHIHVEYSSVGWFADEREIVESVSID